MGRLGMWVCAISLVLASSLLASPSYAAGSARGPHVVAVARPTTGAIGSDFGRCNAAWNPAGDGSGTDTFTPTTHMGWAYQISKLSCDNNGSYDYFSIYFHGTATSSSG